MVSMSVETRPVGDRFVLVKYRTWLDARVSRDDLRAPRMGGGARVKSVVREQSVRERT
jgi:hypothetical protein